MNDLLIYSSGVWLKFTCATLSVPLPEHWHTLPCRSVVLLKVFRRVGSHCILLNKRPTCMEECLPNWFDYKAATGHV